MTEFLFLRLNNIPLYVNTTLSLSIHMLLDMLCCFQALVTVNNGAKNRTMQIAIQDPDFHFLWIYIPRTRIPSSQGVSFLSFWGNFTQFSTVLIPAGAQNYAKFFPTYQWQTRRKILDLRAFISEREKDQYKINFKNIHSILKVESVVEKEIRAT